MNPSSLGVSSQLDRALDGGIGNGELAILIAPPARGKTALLCKIGERAASQGHNVFHATLEISAGKVAARYYSAATRRTAKELSGDKELVLEAAKALKSAGGSVIVRRWPPKRCGIEDLKAAIKYERVKRGPTIDFVIVDYATLMKPIGGGKKELRWTYGDLIMEIAGIGY